MQTGSGIFDMCGRIGLVTGGATGLGKVYCEALAEFGADVSIADINEKEAQQTAEQIRKLGRRSLAINADVSSPDDVQRMVDETLAKLGGIDILINNAGISLRAAKVADMAIEDWDRVIAVNLRGVFLCTRAVLKSMLKQRKGNIINIASIRGVNPSYESAVMNPKSHYAASKGGVISFTKETALEYAREGIRVNCIAPGPHGTGPGRHWRDPEETRRNEEQMVRSIPMGRRGDPVELKGLVVYLASDASSYVTGQVFIPAGGRS